MLKKIYFVNGLLILYLVLSKLFLYKYNELFNYILNPLIWIIILVLSIIIIGNKNNYYNNKKIEIVKISVISALIYIIIFYTIGIFIGFTNNPYSKTLSGIIINFFSILLVIIIKEYLRYLLVNVIVSIKKFKLLLITFFIFLLYDVSFIYNMNNLENINDVIGVIAMELIPFSVLNFYLTYVAYKGGFLANILYQVILLLPNLTISLFPKENEIIKVILNTIIPLFSFFIIRNITIKKEYNLPKRLKKTFSIKGLILLFSIISLVVTFASGLFHYKPSVIITGSMKPVLFEGDLVIIKKEDIKNAVVGDMIQYRFEDYLIIHRIVDIDIKNNEYNLVTKGDNNLTIDKEKVTDEKFIGKVVYRIPYLGYPTYLFNKIFLKKDIPIETGVD